MQHIQLSAIILSYQSLPLLETCIRSIYQHNDIGDALEVIVVDNASTNQEEIHRFLTRHFPEVKVLLQAENRGYGAGNNAGIQHAAGDIVMLINPDVILPEPVFQKVLDHFRDDKLALLGLRQTDPHHKKVHSFLARRLTVAHFLIHFICDKINVFNPAWSVLAGPCFSLRKAFFLASGGYDENIFLYGEERFLHERILRKFPAAKVSLDFSLRYVHAIRDRPFSLETTRRGLESYFYLQDKQGEPRWRTYAETINYYRFLILFYRLKNKAATVIHIRSVLQLLRSQFR